MQEATEANATGSIPARIDAASGRVSINPRDPAFFQDPYPVYEAIRAEMPAFFWEEFRNWNFLDLEDVNAITRDRRFGREILHVASREELGWQPVPEPLKPFYEMDALSIFQREPPNHTRLRTVMARAFVPRQIEKMRGRIHAMANALIDGFEAKREVDLVPAYTTPVPAFVIAELLGVPQSSVPEMLDWSHRMAGMYQLGRTPEMVAAAIAATHEFTAFLIDYIAYRRSNPSDDLISTMIAASDTGETLSEPELVSNCIFILNAGHETTVHATGNGIKRILESGMDAEILLGSPEMIEATIDECIRLHPPVHITDRYVLEDLDYRGVALKKGHRVGLVIGAANRDPARFANGQSFDPSRPRQPHASFGGGIHFCLGGALARLEMEVTMPMIFRRLPGLHLVDTPRYSDTYRFHGLDSLNVAW
ncbi:cytochrome P450 [Kaistia algarum]|uniref:cytochrome P450 n=1 Tax=Kaistia algarum TaxID=2083279 RepID=UPI000CE92A30|nr:cytochrome P450 [Kaistia algarum]MCX5516037.1 cytochrome P450 [Kaistia algarum]PPE77965.1 cytochrome P450 [Kaistia algarum]